MKPRRLFLALAVWFVCVFRAIAAPTTGSLEGKVLVSGSLPSSVYQPVTLNVGACGMEPKSSETFVEDHRGGLGNVAATLEPEHASPSFSMSRAVMNQKLCVFVPHVLVVPQGTVIEFQNSDPVAHNVALRSAANPGFNGVIGPNSYINTQLKQTEVIPVESESHPWMKAWIFVSDTPYYAISDLHGNFSFKDLPAGKYTLVLWHEALGYKRIPVEIQAGRVARFSIIWTLPRRK